MKTKTLQTTKKLLTLLLTVVLLLSLTGCGKDPVKMSFPDPTEEQVSAVKQAQQTPMLLAESTWTLGTKKYVYDNDNHLTRIEVYDSHGLGSYTEYKYTERIGLGTEITEISYCADGTLYNNQCRIITLNEHGQCVQVITTTVNAPSPSVDREPRTDVFEYDAQGRLIHYTDGTEEFQYIYDENGYVVEEKQYYHRGMQKDAWSETIYTRDAAGQPIFIKQDHYRDGRIVIDKSYAIEYTNDENSRLTEINRYEEDSDKIYAQIRYNYDASGKLIGYTETKGPSYPIPGLEWLSLDNEWGAGVKLTWMTPEAYHAQIQK